MGSLFSLICDDRYILDKLSLQAGLETQVQLTSKLEDANNKIKTLETELEEIKSKQVVGEEYPGDDVPIVEEKPEIEPGEEDVE